MDRSCALSELERLARYFFKFLTGGYLTFFRKITFTAPPYELGDRASQSWGPAILTEISYIFTKDIHIRYSENTRSISDIFETDHAHSSAKLYLRAQMEL